jgi:hypothetical protein
VDRFNADTLLLPNSSSIYRVDALIALTHICQWLEKGNMNVCFKRAVVGEFDEYNALRILDHFDILGIHF